ncbi:MAG: hypothetical protein V3W17_00575 [Desulfobacteria bacterium]
MIKKLLLIFLIFALGGCASTPTNQEMALYPPSGDDNRMSSLLSENYVEGHTVISFPYNLSVADDFMVAKETDAKSLVLFALKLEKKKKYAEAATFFREAADLQEEGAPASHFRLSCLGATAVCWLKAGKDKKFHITVSNIRDELDRFQQADLSDQFSVLIAISEKLKGKSPRLNRSLPQPVKTLFEDPRRMP